jgi:hypothetical protein
MESWSVSSPVVADKHNLDEEHDLDPQSRENRVLIIIFFLSVYFNKQ